MSDFIFDNVELNVQVPSPVMNYQDKEVFVVDEVGVTVRPDNGYDALASVDIKPVLESKVLNITSNGSTSVVPSDGFCGIGDISLNVNVPTSQYTYRMESVTIDVGNGTPVSFPMRKFNTRVYSYDSQYFINASTSNTQFNVVVFGSYIGGYDVGTRFSVNCFYMNRI